MELFARPLDGSTATETVLRRLARRARRRGVSGPAALTGDWFDGSAVIAPSVTVAPVPPGRALRVLDAAAQTVESTVPGAVGGGYLGYLGYGLTDPGSWPQPRRLPTAAWGWADHVLRRAADGQWWFESLAPVEQARAYFEDLRDITSTGLALGSPRWSAGTVVAPDADTYRKAVSGCIEEIAAGEIFQANICTRFTADFDGDPLELFAAGSRRMTPARAAFVAGDWGAVASLSPELFLSRHGDTARSLPIKGTLPRRGPQDDGNATLLRESTKEVAENIMILDMARNDLGRVAVPGSVTVPHLLDVQPHPGVWHLVSEASARLPTELSTSDLLAAMYPPASVTGAPKIRALEIIADLEQQPREVYCGSVGMVSPVAGCELNVAIRTFEYADGTIQLGVGGGITADSDPEREWQECLTKAAPLLSLLKP